jgi:hypothetical protein
MYDEIERVEFMVEEVEQVTFGQVIMLGLGRITRHPFKALII